MYCPKTPVPMPVRPPLLVGIDEIGRLHIHRDGVTLKLEGDDARLLLKTLQSFHGAREERERENNGKPE